MNVDANLVAGAGARSHSANLLGQGFEGLGQFLKQSRELRQALVRLGKDFSSR